MNRRYEEGIAMYRKALQLDPTLQSARSEMGINLMRLGLEKEAREALETAYNENYRSPATVNTLIWVMIPVLARMIGMRFPFFEKAQPFDGMERQKAT